MQAFIKEIIFKEKTIEVVFSGCSFRCPFCKTPELIETKKEHEKELKEAISLIKEYSNQAEEIIFTGGEPLLQRPALKQLMKLSKELKLRTKLKTSGTKPNVLRELTDLGYVDFIIFRIKSPLGTSLEKTTKSQTFFKNTEEIITDIKLSLKILKRNEDKINIEFVTDIVPGLIFRKEEIEKIGNEISNIRSLWTLKQYFPDENVLSKIYRNISPPNEKFMENLKEFLLEKFPEMIIQIKLSEADHKDQD